MPQCQRCGEKVLQLLKAIAQSQPILGDDSQLRASSVRHYHHHHHHRQHPHPHSRHRDSPNNKAQQFGITWKLHSILAEREPRPRPRPLPIPSHPATRTRFQRWAGFGFVGQVLLSRTI